MIYYKSTRGQDQKRYKFSESLLTGMALDRGLLVPEKIPQISLAEIEKLVGKNYQEIALKIFEKFETDFSNEILKKVIKKSYGKNFDISEIAPIIKLKKKQYLLELWHGPTVAFKDMALQIMPQLFLEALKKLERKEKYLVLAATSGDTGIAALSGFKDLEKLAVMVLYPLGRVAKLQESQMLTQEGRNLEVASLQSDFDTTQKVVKEIFADAKFNDYLLAKFNTRLSSANSINWGRLIPQTIYYFTSYLRLIKIGEIKVGEQINIVVPTGNFGNILAGFLAKKMGLPLDKLICASNENNALTNFLKTGTYDTRNKKMIKTFSPAMDILIASNIERLLFFVTQDKVKVDSWMNNLGINKMFSIDEETLNIIKQHFQSDWVSDEESLQNIKNNYLKNKYLFDPHTSIAVQVAQDFINKQGDKRVILICSTAHWSKFPAVICKALDLKVNSDDEFQMLEKIAVLENVTPVPKSISSLKKKKKRFNKSSQPDVESVKFLIKEFLTNVKT